jgi:hypothetical protein
MIRCRYAAAVMKHRDRSFRTGVANPRSLPTADEIAALLKPPSGRCPGRSRPAGLVRLGLADNLFDWDTSPVMREKRR